MEIGADTGAGPVTQTNAQTNLLASVSTETETKKLDTGTLQVSTVFPNILVRR